MRLLLLLLLLAAAAGWLALALAVLAVVCGGLGWGLGASCQNGLHGTAWHRIELHRTAGMVGQHLSTLGRVKVVGSCTY